MAEPTPAEKDQQNEQQDEALRLRRMLSNGYAALLGNQTAKDFSRFTFEEAMDQQIERIEGKGTTLRPNLLDRIAKIKSEVTSAVQQIKEQPPENFREPDSDDVDKQLDEAEQAEYAAWEAETLENREQLEE